MQARYGLEMLQSRAGHLCVGKTEGLQIRQRLQMSQSDIGHFRGPEIQGLQLSQALQRNQTYVGDLGAGQRAGRIAFCCRQQLRDPRADCIDARARDRGSEEHGMHERLRGLPLLSTLPWLAGLTLLSRLRSACLVLPSPALDRDVVMHVLHAGDLPNTVPCRHLCVSIADLPGECHNALHDLHVDVRVVGDLPLVVQPVLQTLLLLGQGARR